MSGWNRRKVCNLAIYRVIKKNAKEVYRESNSHIFQIELLQFCAKLSIHISFYPEASFGLRVLPPDLQNTLVKVPLILRVIDLGQI